MKFTVDQHSLTDGVNWVSRSLSTRPIKTELLGIKIDATGDEVILSGSDLETSSKAHFKADILEKGAVLVPGKLLAEICRSLPNKPISIVLILIALLFFQLLIDSQIVLHCILSVMLP